MGASAAVLTRTFFCVSHPRIDRNTSTRAMEGQLRCPNQKVVSILGSASLIPQGEGGAAARICFVADKFITILL